MLVSSFKPPLGLNEKTHETGFCSSPRARFSRLHTCPASVLLSGTAPVAPVVAATPIAAAVIGACCSDGGGGGGGDDNDEKEGGCERCERGDLASEGVMGGESGTADCGVVGRVLGLSCSKCTEALSSSPVMRLSTGCVFSIHASIS
ncbi:hypothetical protein BC937DRAFT_94425 [Endogone sp. FLAS-F59071]|nr:hypothetical protein BC937DRAFT_94425 [Endogone sp. FLAS-F59071]|eukprot:RUS14050.1 hypothetical protein BC937DRAFT_94425 [Endogone sp. FLAS-F59071]